MGVGRAARAARAAISSRSPTAPAARPASAPTRPCKRILGETALTPAAHLTCVAATRDEIDDVIRDYHDAGVRHIVALRGDPAGGIGEQIRAASGRLRERRRSGRRHQAQSPTSKCRCRPIRRSIRTAPTVEADIDMLKAKVDAGATRAITQFFFENDLLLPLSRPRARARHRHPDRAGHPAGAELQADDEFRRARRRLGAALAGRALRRAR